jgi:hypothetical protein
MRDVAFQIAEHAPGYAEKTNAYDCYLELSNGRTKSGHGDKVS